MSRYVLSSEALLKLDDIWGYIAQDDIEAADRWIAKLLDACEMLARNPRVGHTRKDLTELSPLLAGWCVPHHLSDLGKCNRDCCHHPRRTRHPFLFAPPSLIPVPCRYTFLLWTQLAVAPQS
jgi:hypothetical protein